MLTLRRDGGQGFSGSAMLPMTELEYTGVMETLKELEKRFTIKKSKDL